jgi:hypothetical protein
MPFVWALGELQSHQASVASGTWSRSASSKKYRYARCQGRKSEIAGGGGWWMQKLPGTPWIPAKNWKPRLSEIASTAPNASRSACRCDCESR